VTVVVDKINFNPLQVILEVITIKLAPRTFNVWSHLGRSFVTPHPIHECNVIYTKILI
jgi:hypothetical protein